MAAAAARQRALLQRAVRSGSNPSTWEYGAISESLCLAPSDADLRATPRGQAGAETDVEDSGDVAHGDSADPELGRSLLGPNNDFPSLSTVDGINQMVLAKDAERQAASGRGGTRCVMAVILLALLVGSLLVVLLLALAASGNARFGTVGTWVMTSNYIIALSCECGGVPGAGQRETHAGNLRSDLTCRVRARSAVPHRLSRAGRLRNVCAQPLPGRPQADQHSERAAWAARATVVMIVTKPLIRDRARARARAPRVLQRMRSCGHSMRLRAAVLRTRARFDALPAIHVASRRQPSDRLIPPALARSQLLSFDFLVLILIFALFVLCCGVTHLVHGIGYGNSWLSAGANMVTAVVSLVAW
jgi:hypothetical protein